MAYLTVVLTSDQLIPHCEIFLCFEMESPIFLEPLSPGQTGTVGHPNLDPLNLRP